MASLGDTQICIATIFYNEELNLPKLLKSFELLKSSSELDSINFLFVNNDSKDRSCEVVEEWISKNSWCDFELVHRKSNHISKARQQVMEHGDTEWVLFVDADSEITLNWLDRVVHAIEQCNPSTAVVGGASKYAVRCSWHKFVVPLARYFPIGKKSDLRVFVDHVPTNNCLLRRAQVLDVGGFHPFFQYVGEDLDLSVRLRKKFRIVYDPSFEVSHGLSENIFDWYKKMALYGRAQSFVYINNGGGLLIEKFLPAVLALLVVPLFTSTSFLSLFYLFFILLVPRIRFYFLTFLFYGLGEVIGFFIGFFHLRIKKMGKRALITDNTPS